jgi:hypothetical protein
MAHKWKRPDLPEANKGAGLAGGWLMIIAGIVAGAIGLSALSEPYPDFNGYALAALGIACGTLGLLVVPVCLIMREIRRSAFEAALRAGEVEILESRTADPYEQFMARERATPEPAGND